MFKPSQKGIFSKSLFGRLSFILKLFKNYLDVIKSYKKVNLN